jgi:hypothetical protein
MRLMQSKAIEGASEITFRGNTQAKTTIPGRMDYPVPSAAFPIIGSLEGLLQHSLGLCVSARAAFPPILASSPFLSTMDHLLSYNQQDFSTPNIRLLH